MLKLGCSWVFCVIRVSIFVTIYIFFLLLLSFIRSFNSLFFFCSILAPLIPVTTTTRARWVLLTNIWCPHKSKRKIHSQVQLCQYHTWLLVTRIYGWTRLNKKHRQRETEKERIMDLFQWIAFQEMVHIYIGNKTHRQRRQRQRTTNSRAERARRMRVCLQVGQLKIHLLQTHMRWTIQVIFIWIKFNVC